MQLRATRVSIRQLVADRVHITPAEAVALLQAIAHLERDGGDVAELSELKLDREGRISRPARNAAPPAESVRTESATRRYGSLLLTLMNGSSEHPLLRDIAVVSSGGAGRLPAAARPFDAVEELFDSLQPYAAADAAGARQAVFDRWLAAHSRGVEETEAVPLLPPIESFPAPDPAKAAAEMPMAPAHRVVPTSFDDVRRSRARAGLSLEEISRRTKVPVPCLEGLEEGDFSTFPRGIFARAYVKGYAREAGLDERALLALAEPHLPGEEPLEYIRSVKQEGTRALSKSSRATRSPDAGPFALGATALAVAVVLICTVLLASVWFGEPEPVVPAAELTSGDESGTSDSVAEGTTGTGEANVPPEMTPRDEGRGSAHSGLHVRPAPQSDRDEAPRFSVPAAGNPAPQGPEPRLRPLSMEEDTAVGMYSPSFSPRGVAFHQGRSGATSLVEAFRVPDGSMQLTTILEDGATNYHVQVSPDGRLVAFDSDRDGERGVYIATRDGGGVRRVSGPGFAAIPTWTPDGSKLAFVRASRSDDRAWNLWTLELASGELQQVTAHERGRPWGGSWFPDNRRVAYSLDDRLVVLDTTTGQRQVHRSPLEGRSVRTPAVSPNGEHIAFQVYRDGVWLLDLASGSTRRILDDGSAEEFAWAPDGRQLAFHSRRSGSWKIWILATD